MRQRNLIYTKETMNITNLALVIVGIILVLFGLMLLAISYAQENKNKFKESQRPTGPQSV